MARDGDDGERGSGVIQKEGFYCSLGKSLLDTEDLAGVVVVLNGCQVGRWSKSMKKE